MRQKHHNFLSALLHAFTATCCERQGKKYTVCILYDIICWVKPTVLVEKGKESIGKGRETEREAKGNRAKGKAGKGKEWIGRIECIGMCESENKKRIEGKKKPAKEQKGYIILYVMKDTKERKGYKNDVSDKICLGCGGSAPKVLPCQWNLGHLAEKPLFWPSPGQGWCCQFALFHGNIELEALAVESGLPLLVSGMDTEWARLGKLTTPLQTA